MTKFFLNGILILNCIFVSAQNNIENVRIDYSVNNVALKEIFDDLEQKYEIKFSYATESIEDILIGGQVENATIDEVMDFLLKDHSMEYKILNDNILLRKADDFELIENAQYQKSLHIKGKVIQESDSEYVAFASVYISNSQIGTYTNEFGMFDLEIPARYSNEKLIIHSLGFEDQVYQIEKLEKDILLVSLTNGGIAIDEIMIVNQEKAIQIISSDHAISLSKAQLENTTSGLIGSDLTRQLQLLPGISASDDASADIKIRGSNSDETLIILDGMPIYNASHYYGIFSSINTAFLTQVNLYKNNFPIQYGGKTAGIIELYSKGAVADQAEIEGEVNLLNVSMNASIPLTKKFGILIAGRSTYSNVSNSGFNSFVTRSDPNVEVLNFLDQIPNNATDPNFKFRDINAKIFWNNGLNQKLSLNFYSSRDNFSNGFQRIIEGPNDRRIDLENVEEQEWKNTSAAINHEMKFSNHWNLKSSIYYTNYFNDAFSDFNLKPLEGMDNQFSNFGFRQSNELLDIGGYSQIEYEADRQNLILGIGYIRHDVIYNFEENGRVNLQGDAVVSELSPYFSHNWMPNNKFQIKYGLRSTLFSETNKVYISPRLLINYKFSDQLSLKSSYSYNQQFIREFDYEYQGQNMSLWLSSKSQDIPVLLSQNIMLGGSMRIGPVMLDLEFYRKKMTGILEYAIPNPSDNRDVTNPRNYELFSGDGISQGVDILISSGAGQWDTYLSYTLSEINYSFNEIARGAYFPSEDDRRLQLKWVNELRYHDFSFGANSIYSSGRAYTDLRKVKDIRNSLPNQRFKRLPAYSRIDFSVNYHFKINNFNSSFGVSLFNALDNQNLKYLQTVVSTRVENGTPINTLIGSEANLLSRTLNLSLKIGI